MSDAIQVSNVDKLEPDMQNVFHMFARAANAIVRASDLAREVSSLSSKMEHTDHALAQITEQRSGLELALDQTTNALENAKDQIASQADLLQMRREDITKLEADNSHLTTRLALTTRQYDEISLSLEHMTTDRDDLRKAYDEAETKLKKFREILGQPEVVPLPAPSQQVIETHDDPRPSATADNGEHVPTTVQASVEPAPDTHEASLTEVTSKNSEPAFDSEGRPHEAYNPNKEGGPDASVGKYEHELPKF